VYAQRLEETKSARVLAGDATGFSVLFRNLNVLQHP
jgi:hypothetical protein